MNRRRIGLGILAAGAGVAARRRLRARLDPGTGDLAAPSVDPPVADTPASEPNTVTSNAVTPNAVTPNAVTPNAVTSNAVTPNAVTSTAPADDAVGDAPPVTEPLSSASLIEAGREATNGVVADDDPEPPVAAAPIVLPTMPRAGSNEVPNPDVVMVPKADGSSPAFVAPKAVPAPAPAPDPAPAVTETATLAAEPVAARAPVAPSPALVSPSSPGSERHESPAQKVKWYRRRFYGWSVPTLMFLSLLGIAAFVASVVPLPYYRISPGKVYDTVERVDVPGELAFVPDGQIGFVTVARTADITALQWLDAKLDKNVRIRHEDEIRGTQSLDEARATDLRRMQVSKDAAVVVALERLGYELISTPVGVEVARVFACTAADGTLGTGDLIVGVNGVPTPDGPQLVEQLISIGIGEDVELLVERIDPANPAASIRTDLVGLTLGSADDPCIEDGVRADEPRPFIGIQTATMFEEELPLDVDVRTGTVGGPSAGLAFTLAIMDVLSEGELTNGLNIVATGSINRDERIGAVGAIHQKTVAAERAGTDLFLVPACCDNFVDRTTGEPLELPSNVDEALMYADEMRVVGVDTLEEALIAIGEMGGNVDRFLIDS